MLFYESIEPRGFLTAMALMDEKGNCVCEEFSRVCRSDATGFLFSRYETSHRELPEYGLDLKDAY